MKTLISRHPLSASLISGFALLLFLFLAVGSEPLLEDVAFSQETDFDTTDSTYTVVYETGGLDGHPVKTVTYNGRRDNWGRWHGPATITTHSDQAPVCVEEVNFEHNILHGPYEATQGGNVKSACYFRGHETAGEHNDLKASEDWTGFDELDDQYTWFLVTMENFGYTPDSVRSLTDRLEEIIYAVSFSADEFDGRYADAIDSLEMTPYDTMITQYMEIAVMYGLDNLRQDVFRMAVIDHFRAPEGPLYDMVETRYRPYLQSIIAEGVTEQEFGRFCEVLDSTMKADAVEATYDPESPFFVDSVDVHFYNAMMWIVDTDGLKSAFAPRPRDVLRSVRLLDGYDASEVSQLVLMQMLMLYMEGDVIRNALRSVCYGKLGEAELPVVEAEIQYRESSSTIHFEGYVFDDGGDEVSKRGMAWAPYYNPGLSDLVVDGGAGTGTFTVTLDGLVEGNTYYLRPFATNGAGTAYGQCIQFTATSTVGYSLDESFVNQLEIWPNPATDFGSLRFALEKEAAVRLQILDMDGRLQRSIELGSLTSGAQQVYVDLTGLRSGSYICRLLSENRPVRTTRLVIAR